MCAKVISPGGISKRGVPAAMEGRELGFASGRIPKARTYFPFAVLTSAAPKHIRREDQHFAHRLKKRSDTVREPKENISAKDSEIKGGPDR